MSINFSFIVQNLAYEKRYKLLGGVNGENYYVLIKCHKSKMKGIKPATNNSLPVKWLSKFLAAHALDKLKSGTINYQLDKGSNLG